jgi:hypothetical protein
MEAQQGREVFRRLDGWLGDCRIGYSVIKTGAPRGTLHKASAGFVTNADGLSAFCNLATSLMLVVV